MTDPSYQIHERECYTPLMYRRGVPQPHRHYYPLPKSKWSHCSHILYVVQMYECLEKRVCHVDLSPNFSSCAISEDVVNLWQQIVIRYGDFIQFSVVVHPSR